MSSGEDKVRRMMWDLSIVIPVYGCADCLSVLYGRLQAVLESLNVQYEIIFIDDGSHDGSWDIVAAIALKDKKVKAVKLSRNFGQHAAITAGLAESSGKRVIIMDCDLQDPPEEIPRLYEKANKNYDVVFARRQARQHTLIRRWGANLYFRMLRLFNADVHNAEYGSFSIISRRVVDEFLRFKDQDRHYLFILKWLGFRWTDVEYLHGDRYGGKSAYTLKKLIGHAVDGVCFQTTAFLGWIVYLGFMVSFSGLLLACYYVYHYFTYSAYPGWTSLAVLILVIGGIIILSTGVTGLYIGKIFEQVKGRPLYVVEKKLINGRDDPQDEPKAI